MKRELVGGPLDGKIMDVKHPILKRAVPVDLIACSYLPGDEVPIEAPITVIDTYEAVDVFDEGDESEPDRPPCWKMLMRYRGRRKD